MKTLYIECNMGCAGDMLMSALYELLDDQEGFLHTMNGLGLPGLKVEAQKAATCGIVGTHMSVTVHGEEEKSCDQGHDHDHTHDHEHGHDHDHGHGHAHEHAHDHEHTHDHDHSHDHAHSHHHTGLWDIRGHIAALPLPAQVREQAVKVYDRLAAAESRAHGCPVDQVHFHEVGALDAVADVAGVCYALFLLQADNIVVSPVHVGSGLVRCAHGLVPVPAPATAALLEGVPCYGGAIRGELCTPTGAALLSEFAHSFGQMPVMSVQKVGYGVGTKEFEAANCVRAFLGESADMAGANGEILELVCNIDDMTPEALAFACARLLELGALDVYTTPGQMKKGRPGWVLTALCEPGGEGELAKAILAQTTTNGLRVRPCEKYFLTPQMDRVDTRWGPVRVKRASGFGVTHVKPEYDDVAAIAKAESLPFAAVWNEVLQTAEK